MSGYISGAVWISGPKHHNQRYVLLAIADNANDHGYCWPSVDTIVDKCLISKSTVLRCLAALEKEGWLQINRKSVEHKGSTYQIILEKLTFERPKSGVRVKPDKKSGVTDDNSQVSLTIKSGVTDDNAIRKNRQEPSIEPSQSLEPSAQCPKKGSRIPNNFRVTQDHRNWAMKEHYPSPDKFIDGFRDYWIARPGVGGVKLDWDATFRNWIRKASESSYGRNGSGNGSRNGTGSTKTTTDDVDDVLPTLYGTGA